MEQPPITQKAPERNRGGRWVTIGDEAWRIPALSLKDVQEIQGPVQGLRGLSTGEGIAPEQWATVIDIVLRALRRNYPSLTADEVSEMLDMENYQQVLGAVLSVGGFERRTASGGATPSASPPTGTGSTPP